MASIIGVCGIVCTECPAYRATKANDDTLRARTAEEWSRMFNADIKPENVNCEGCTPDTGVKFHHCTECEIRLCAIAKGLDNCSHCADYACQKLEDFFKMVPDAKATLDGLR